MGDEWNSGNDTAIMAEKPSAAGVSAGRLRSFIERIERLEEEKEKTATDIREVYAELKGEGFDAKTIRQIVRLRKKDADERAEEEALLDTYMAALGMG